jgi:hypothetical protein
VPVGDVQVVDQRAPTRVVVEERVGESDQALVLGEDRAPARVGLVQPLGPDGDAIGDDVAVEEVVGLCAPVVTAPAVRVEMGHGRGVGWAREPERQRHGRDVTATP